MTRTRMLTAGAAVALLLAACAGPAQDQGEQEPQAEPEATGSEEAGADADAAAEDADETTDTDEAPDTDTRDGEEGPLPDPDRLEDPCAPHEGREMDSFIDLVAPVQKQVVSGEMDLVGCANVFEATVVWHLLDGDGRLLDEGFTTATCGSGCVGEFSDVVPLEEVADEPVAYLQVFSPNMADEGPERLEEVEVMVVIE